MPVITVAPLYLPLTAALWVASLAAIARSTCHLAVFAVTRKEQCARRVYGWQAAAFGLGSALLLSVEAWGAAVAFGAVAAGIAVLRRRERNQGKAAA